MAQPCVVPGCERPARGRALCNHHLMKAKNRSWSRLQNHFYDHYLSFFEEEKAKLISEEGRPKV